ncbi:MAG: hypothetical protein PVJ92_03085 [Candidatus Dependentiae bacterium]|jgi:hypothetical protein
MFQFITKTDWAQKPGGCILVADAAKSSLFIATLRQLIAQKHPEMQQQILHLPNTAAGMHGVRGQLSQTFLGTAIRYWVTTPSPWQAKLKKQWFDLLAGYTGPHTIIMVMSEDDAGYFVGRKNVQRLVLPETITKQGLGKMAAAFGKDRAARALTEQDLAPTGLLTLDQACQLLIHLEFLPLRQRDAVASYLGKLIPESSTLLEVSDLFFRRQWDRFFTVWRRLTGEYSDMFWVAFFTEQVWRAYYVQQAMKKNDRALARRLSFRLPSTYTTRTWRQIKSTELLELYEQLYFFDTRVKRGSSFTMNEFLLTTNYVTGQQE